MNKRGILKILIFIFIILNFYSVYAQSQNPTFQCDNDKEMFSLSGLTNAHGEKYERDKFTSPKEVCFNEFFSGTLTNPHSGNGKVIRLSGDENAHFEAPSGTTNGYSDVKYGDLTCVVIDNNLQNSCQSAAGMNNRGCQIIALSGLTNAHASFIPNANPSQYSKKLCCSSAIAQCRCDYDGICEQESGENMYNCPDCIILSGVKLKALDFQKNSTCPIQEGWSPVYPEDAGWRDVSPNPPGIVGVLNDGQNLAEDPLRDVKIDYHRVKDGTFVIDLKSSSPVKYSVDVYAGSKTEPTKANKVYFDGSQQVVVASSVNLEAGRYEKYNVNVFPNNNGFLNLKFEKASENDNFNLNGIEIRSLCGNGIQEDQEECDNGVIATSRIIISGNCIIDLSDGYANNADWSMPTLRCKNNVCGDGYIAGNEECDNGTMTSQGRDPDCSSQCVKISNPQEINFCNRHDANPQGYAPLLRKVGSDNCNAQVVDCDGYNYLTLNNGRDCYGTQFNGNINQFKEKACTLDCNGAANSREQLSQLPDGVTNVKCAWEDVPAQGGGTEKKCKVKYDYNGLLCGQEIIGGEECGAEDSVRTVQVRVKNLAGGRASECGVCNDQSNPGASEIICQIEAPCPKVLQLPFFSWINFAIAAIVIILIYLVYLKRKK